MTPERLEALKREWKGRGTTKTASLILELIQAVETARAVAFEEAAQWHDSREKAHRAAAVDGNGRIIAAAAHNASALVFRQDAGLPPELVAVSRQTMEELVTSLRRAHEDSERGSVTGLDHKLGENVEGCSGCGCVAELTQLLGGYWEAIPSTPGTVDLVTFRKA